MNDVALSAEVVRFAIAEAPNLPWKQLFEEGAKSFNAICVGAGCLTGTGFLFLLKSAVKNWAMDHREQNNNTNGVTNEVYFSPDADADSYLPFATGSLQDGTNAHSESRKKHR